MRFVAFLGGINVGGHRVSMDRLKKEFEALGYDEVWTFIASGNVVFRARGKAASIERAIEARLEKALGYAVPTFVRDDASVQEIAAREPFDDLLPNDSQYVGLLRAAPTAAAKRATEALSNATDTFVVKGSELHWRIHGKLLDSSVKASVIAKAIGQPSTVRNVTSLRKLAAKL